MGDSRLGQQFGGNLVAKPVSGVERGRSQHKHQYPFLRLRREFVADCGVVIQFREAFKEGPGLAVLVEFPLPAPGYFREYLGSINHCYAPLQLGSQSLGGIGGKGRRFNYVSRHLLQDVHRLLQIFRLIFKQTQLLKNAHQRNETVWESSPGRCLVVDNENRDTFLFS